MGVDLYTEQTYRPVNTVSFQIIIRRAIEILCWVSFIAAVVKNLFFTIIIINVIKYKRKLRYLEIPRVLNYIWQLGETNVNS